MLKSPPIKNFKELAALLEEYEIGPNYENGIEVLPTSYPCLLLVSYGREENEFEFVYLSYFTDE